MAHKEDLVAQEEVEKQRASGLPLVHVKKLNDEIPVTLNSKQDVEEQIDNLCAIHGELAVFVDGVSARRRAEDRDEKHVPQRSSVRHDDQFDIDGKKYSLAEITAMARKRKGVSHKNWNDLPDGERELLIDQELDMLRNPPKPEDPKVVVPEGGK